MNQYSKFLPDLVVNICPLGCNGKCAEIWINETIGHRIICDCIKCGHNKKCGTSAEIRESGADAIYKVQSSSKEANQIR